ncbi:hypothetical protein Tco_0765600 [Tanacetum coccineum]
MDYFISVHPRSNVRFSALLLDSEEKSSFILIIFPSMILQKIIWMSHVTMADANINAPEVPVVAASLPTRSDEQICLVQLGSPGCRGGHLPLSSIFDSRERPKDLKDQGLLYCRFCEVLLTGQILIMLRGYGNSLLSSRHRFHKRPGSPLYMPYDEYALGYLKFSFKNTKRVRFRMTIPNTLITEDIRTASYYPEILSRLLKSAFLAGKKSSDDDARLPNQLRGQNQKKPRSQT